MTDEKNQRKPWYRLRNIVLAMVMLFVGGIIYAWYWQATMEPTVSHDYEQDLIDLSVSVQFTSDPASHDNAWPHLMRISEIVREMSEEDDGTAESYIGELRFQQLDELLKGLELDGASEAYRTVIDELDRRGAMEMITQARACTIIVKREYIDDGGQLIGAYLPEISNLGLYARLQLVGAELALQDGNLEAAIRFLSHAMFISEAFSRQPLLIFHIVASRLAMEILNFVRQNLVRYSFNDESLVRLESILRNCSIPEQASLALEGERLTQLDTIQHMFTDDGTGDGVLILSRYNEAFLEIDHALGNFYGLLLASRAETVLVIDDYFDRMSVRADLMHYERLEKTFDDNAYLWNLGHRYRYLMTIMPATEKVIDAADRLRCELAGTRLLVAIEHFRLVRDAPPESLSALLQEFLDELPVDPYSTDGFRYLVQDETVNGEWPYLLYSVGEDGVDDSGAVNPDGSVHWSSFKIGEGFDLIFTPPLPDPARSEGDEGSNRQ